MRDADSEDAALPDTPDEDELVEVLREEAQSLGVSIEAKKLGAHTK